MPLPSGPYTAAFQAALWQAFERSYVDAFRRTPPTSQVEIINVRVSVSVELGDRALPVRAALRLGAEVSKGTAPSRDDQVTTSPVPSKRAEAAAASASGDASVARTKSSRTDLPARVRRSSAWAHALGRRARQVLTEESPGEPWAYIRQRLADELAG